MKSSAGLLKVHLTPKDKDSKNEFLKALAWSRGSDNCGISMLHAIAEARKYAPHRQYAYYTLFAYDLNNKEAAENSAASIRVPSRVASNER